MIKRLGLAIVAAVALFLYAMPGAQSQVTLPALMGCLYASPTPLAPSGSGVVPIRCDNAGQPNSLTPFVHYAALSAATTGPTAAAATAGPGTLGTVTVANGSAATTYLQIFDVPVASVVLGTTKPDKVVGCATLQTCSFTPTTPGTAFTSAISFVCCTTTAVGSTGSNVATIYVMIDHK